MKKCREAGITVPIVPGIKILQSVKQLTNLPKNFYIDIPADLVDEVLKAKPEHVLEVGVEWAAKQVEDLLNNNVPAIHFYIMQNAKPITKLMDKLKI